MKIATLRWSILTTATAVLLFGGLLLLDFGASIPNLSCMYAPDRSGTCFLYTLQRYFGGPTLTGTLAFLRAFLIFSILAIVFGKAWCGWLCPFGFLQDSADLVRRRVFKLDYLRFPEKTRDRLSVVKWVLLLIAIFVPVLSAFPLLAYGMAIDLPIPFCQLCPGKYIIPLFTKGTVQVCSVCPGRYSAPLSAGGTPHVAVNYHSPTAITMSLLGLAIAAVVIFGSLLKRRFFCSYCPMGLLLSFYNRISFLRLKKDPLKCTYCEACYNACPVDIKAIYSEREKETIYHADCIMCMKCIENCPEDGALSASFLGIKVYTSKHETFCKRKG